jgi:hypothetical protein
LNTCVHAYETKTNLSMESKVIIVVPSYLEVDSFTLLSKNRFSLLHRIKCLKSPERDIDLKFLECKVMLIVFLSLD